MNAAIWEDFIDIFYAPSQVFARREHGNFWVPLIVVTLLAGVLFYLNSGLFRPMVDAEFDRAMATAMRLAALVQPDLFHSLVLISPTGFGFTSKDERATYANQVAAMERAARVTRPTTSLPAGSRPRRLSVAMARHHR